MDSIDFDIAIHPADQHVVRTAYLARSERLSHILIKRRILFCLI